MMERYGYKYVEKKEDLKALSKTIKREFAVSHTFDPHFICEVCWLGNYRVCEHVIYICAAVCGNVWSAFLKIKEY